MAQPAVGRGNGTPRKHGMTGTPTYNAWVAMRQRCSNRNAKRADRYVGRGIRVCDRWAVFTNFLADMGVRPDGLSLERKNNDGDYEPGNCVWATALEQSNNRSYNRLITRDGRTQTLSQWCRELGLSRAGAKYRLKVHGSIFIGRGSH